MTTQHKVEMSRDTYDKLCQENAALREIVRAYLDGASESESEAIEGEAYGMNVLLTPKQWLDKRALAALLREK